MDTRTTRPNSQSGLVVEIAALRAVLGSDWHDGLAPRYQALAARLGAAITSGELAPGSRLPAEREFAQALGLSRTTVVSAYDVLREDGRVQSQVGSGTYVAKRPTQRRMMLRDLVDARATSSNRRHEDASVLNLSVSQPRSFEVELRSAISAAADVIGPLADSIVYAPQGLSELRTVVAETYVRRGLETDPHQILITSGAQQAIALLAELYVEPKRPVLVESPTYVGAIDVLSARRANIVTLPDTIAELPIRDIESVLRRVNPSLTFLMPSCHTITGAVTDRATQQRLAELSGELDLPVIDDDIFSTLTLAERPSPPIAVYAEDAPIFTIGSTSKLLWNGLRVGWLRAPEAVISRLVRLKSASDLGTSLIAQLVAANLLVDQDALVVRRREEIQARLDLAGRLLTATVPEWRWKPPLGGWSLWLDLGGRWASELVSAAQRRGVLIVPGTSFSPDGKHDDHIRLMYVHSEEVLIEAIRRLGLAWADISHMTSDVASSRPHLSTR